MRRFCDAHSDWLTVVQLPPYAPELNATEGVWAHVKRDLGNLLAGTVDELAASAKRLLKRIQYRPELIDGFRAQTGVALDPQPVARPRPFNLCNGPVLAPGRRARHPISGQAPDHGRGHGLTVGLEFSWRRECSPTGGYRHRAFRIRIGPAAPLRPPPLGGVPVPADRLPAVDARTRRLAAVTTLTRPEG